MATLTPNENTVWQGLITDYQPNSDPIRLSSLIKAIKRLYPSKTKIDERNARRIVRVLLREGLLRQHGEADCYYLTEVTPQVKSSYHVALHRGGASF